MPDALQRYFENYPTRQSGLLPRLFRQGEAKRAQVIRSWLPDMTGLSILDAGCGDGIFLARQIRGRPARVRLEDCVEKWTDLARINLSEAADSVDAVTTDVRSSTDPHTYDIVLALGLFDYASDWPGLLAQLKSRTRGVLFVDFPKSGTWHSRIRRLWLRSRGLRIHATDRAGLESLLAQEMSGPEITELPLQWVVGIGHLGNRR